MPSTIIFDLDGTLFRTETVDVPAFNRALAEAGLPVQTPSDILALIGQPLKTIVRRLSGSNDPRLLDFLMAQVKHHEIRLIRSDGRLYPGTHATLESLAADGHRLALCTNGSAIYVDAIIEQFSLGPLFQCVWWKQPGYAKPRAIRRIMSRLPSADTIVVGDRTADLAAARANGCCFVGAGYGFGPDEIRTADHVLSCIADLRAVVAQRAATEQPAPLGPVAPASCQSSRTPRQSGAKSGCSRLKDWGGVAVYSNQPRIPR